ncbi:hypothetical protein BGW42_001608 [Actinomortierella wolfii]|nr:hypothetical protein BGW42_001608 [Actinomortierella wolfii]
MSPSEATPPPTTKKQRPQELSFRTMIPEDHNQVSALFVKVFQREPLGFHMGVQDHEGEAIATDSLKTPVSFVVTDSRRPKGRDIIAFQGNKLIDRTYLEALSKKAPPTYPVEAILDHLIVTWYRQTDIFKNKPDAKIMYYLAVAVDEEYEGLGLAKELLERSMTLTKSLDCDAVVVIASAFATQHLFANRLNFDRMVRMRYEDFEMWTDDVEGERKFPFLGLREPEFIEVYEKKLK